MSFNRLSEADFAKIAVLQLTELQTSMASRSLRLTWSDSLVDYLVKKSYSLTFGARNLRRLIEKEIENGLAEHIIAACDRPLLGAHVTADNGELHIETI